MTTAPALYPGLHSHHAGLAFPARALAAVLCMWQVMSWFAGRLAPEAGGFWALRVVSASVAVALVPGVLVCLYALPFRRRAGMELLAFGFAFSFAIVQVLTIVAMLLHIPASAVAPGLVLASLVAALPLLRRTNTARTDFTWGEAVLLFALAAYAAVLYAAGAVMLDGEDYIHVSVIRRLAALNAPALDNIYFAPNVVYTYPFPGIHYLLALIARVSDVDALFVYAKTRFLWGPLAIVFVWAGARFIFGSRAVALASGAVALVLAVCGAFASVPGFWWGQLAPYSHASDVALGVLLPATIVLVLAYLRAGTRRGVAVMFAGSLAMMGALAIVHVRELVQVLVYLTAFVMVLLLRRRHARELRRTVALVAAAVVVAATFLAWHGRTVTHVGALVSQQRADLMARVTAASFADFVTPAPEWLAQFVIYRSTLSWALTPALLLALPLIVWAYRRKPLVWFVAASVLAYLAIIRLPLVAAGYIYLTYFEILFTPARNFIYFVHVAAGVLVFLFATRAATRRGMWLLSAAAALVLAAVVPWQRLNLEQHPDLLFVPASAGLAAALWAEMRRPRDARTRVSSSWSRPRFPVSRIAASLTVLAAGLLASWQLTASVAHRINVRWQGEVTDVRRGELEARFALVRGEQRDDGGTWSYDLLDESSGNIAALVATREAADTHEVERQASRVAPGAPQGTTLRWPGQRLPVIGEFEGVRRVVLMLVALALFAWWLDVHRGAPASPGLLYVSGLVVLVAFGSHPEVGLAQARAGPSSPEALRAGFSCREDAGRLSCPPPGHLIAWIQEHVAVDALFAANAASDLPPSLFVPQQFVGWSGLSANFLDAESLFGPYMSFYGEAQRIHGGQPFFNTHDTTAERVTFVRQLGVTHVLVDPAFYDTIRGSLPEGGRYFEKLYDRNHWAVYRVRREALDIWLKVSDCNGPNENVSHHRRRGVHRQQLRSPRLQQVSRRSDSRPRPAHLRRQPREPAGRLQPRFDPRTPAVLVRRCPERVAGRLAGRAV